MQRRARWGLIGGVVVLVVVAALPSVVAASPMKTKTMRTASATGAASTGQDAVAYQMTPGHTGASTDPQGPQWTSSWTKTLGGTVSYPLIADGDIYVLNEPATLDAFNAATGAVQWSATVDADPTGLAYDNGRVFEQSGADMTAYDAASGNVDWRSTLPPQFSYSSAPTASDGDVYTDGAGSVYALNQSTGVLQWTTPVNDGIDSSPAVGPDGVFESYACDQTDDLNPSTGAQVWQYQSGCDGYSGQTPVLADGNLYLRDRVLLASDGYDESTLAAGPAPAVDGSNVYVEEDGTLRAQTVEFGTTEWTFTGNGVLDTAPIVDDGVVYEGSGSGELFAVSAMTGQALWSTNVGTAISAPANIDEDSFWGLAEGDGLLAVPAGDTLTVFDDPATVPSAPTGVTGVVGTGQTQLQWTVPADNGSPINSFAITAIVNGVAQTPVVVPAGAVGSAIDPTAGATDDYTVAGVPSSALSYGFTVAADNGGGRGAATSASIAPGITSSFFTTFGQGEPNEFTVTTTGFPTPALSVTGTLPAGVTFTDNGNGSAALAGTPAAGTLGTYPVTITAANGVGTDATQAFSLTVGQAPVITSAAATTFTAGSPGSFTVTATGTPAPTFFVGNVVPYDFLDELPYWLTLSSAGVLSGTPPPGANGTLTFPVDASNGVVPDAVEDFTLIVDGPPAITSATGATFSQGYPSSFTVTTDGFPTAALSLTGTLPTGVDFVDNGNGTATLSGTPAVGTFGTYPLTITAANGIGVDATQSFTLIVGQAPAFTSAASATFTDGTTNTFQFAASGFPTPSFSDQGQLPEGFSLTDSGTLTAAAEVAGGVYSLSMVASNGAVPSATQNFVLTVDQAPTYVSGPPALLAAGSAVSWAFTTRGFPVASLQESGPLPAGLTFADEGDGTALLSGTPTLASVGTYPLTVTAGNGVGATATQDFVLTIGEAPTITSAASTTFAVGAAGSFTVQASGTPAPIFSLEAGALPAGVTLSSDGTLSGTPEAGTGGTYTLEVLASNSVSTAIQDFTLTVDQAPTITSGTSDSVVLGLPFSFNITTTGTPQGALSETGALPNGVMFRDQGNGEALVWGTPGDGSVGTYPLSITVDNGITPDATQTFTLTIKPSPLLVTASSATMTAGTNPPVITASYAVFHNGDTQANLTTRAVCTTTATVTSPAGVYPSSCSGASDPDYTFTYLNGVVVVQDLTITTTSLPPATPGDRYQATLRATGGQGRLTWTMTGSLPAGLQLYPNGKLGGRPSRQATAGPYPFTVEVTTKATKRQPSQSVTQALTLTLTLG